MLGGESGVVSPGGVWRGAGVDPEGAVGVPRGAEKSAGEVPRGPEVSPGRMFVGPVAC